MAEPYEQKRESNDNPHCCSMVVDNFCNDIFEIKMENDYYKIIPDITGGNNELVVRVQTSYWSGEGLSRCCIVTNSQGKQNFRNSKWLLISDQWFDRCRHFENGFAVVTLDNKQNYITPEGNLLCSEWFDHCYDFHYEELVQEHYAWARIKRKRYYIDDDGTVYSYKEVKELYKKLGVESMLT